MNAPDWLETQVISGMQTLLVLRLRNSPAADTVNAVVDVWLAAFMARPIGWIQERDEPRIQAAFMKVAGTFDSWPAPANVLAAMPATAEVRSLPKPRKRTPPEVVNGHMARMKKVLDSWTVKMPKQTSLIELNDKVQAMKQGAKHE